MIDEVTIEILEGCGYKRKEAINILNGLKPDSSQFEQLPF